MFNDIDNKMEKNEDGMWEDKELKGSLKEAGKALDKIFDEHKDKNQEELYQKAMKDIFGDNYIPPELVDRIDTYCELEQAIKEDYEWAKQTQIILENFNNEDEKSKSLAFLNGVLFATGRYNDILDEMKED